jgi:hypothetical protein
MPGTSVIDYKISDSNKSRVYVPAAGTGVIDVLRDMPWTLSPSESRLDVPSVTITEYQQTTGQLIAAIVYYSRIANQLARDATSFLDQQDALEVYRYKFLSQPTGFKYVLPYFNPKRISRGNTFGSEKSAFSDLLAFGREIKSNPLFKAPGSQLSTSSSIAAALGAGSTFGKAGVAAFNNTIIPGFVSAEMPSAWSGTEIETIDVSFDLFNTDSYDDVVRNRKFCHLISYQNTPSRRNFAIVDPPVIYSLDIPDVVQFPACYVTALNISNLGNTRTMNIDGGLRTIPEAYRISLSFKSLLMPTRNILRATEESKVVRAIDDSTPFENLSNNILKYYSIDDSTDAGKQNRAALLETIKTQAAEIDKQLGNDQDSLIRASGALGLFLPPGTT